MMNQAKMRNDPGKVKIDESKDLPELLAEKDSLDASFTHAMKLISAEIERIQKGDSKTESDKDITYLDLFAAKNIRVKERVLIPTKQYPRFNFVGKILGPQGSTIKQLQEETGARISVLGKGSMRDKSKEEELRKSGEAKYAHLGLQLHVFIEVMAPIPEVYMRMAHAMGEVKKFLIPEPMEHEQFLDPNYLNGSQDGAGRGRGGPPGRGRGGPPHSAGARGRGMPPRGGALRGGAQRGGAPRGGPGARGGPARGAPAGGRGGPPSASPRGSTAPRSRPPSAGAPRMLPPQALGHQEHQQHQHPHAPPPKPEAYQEYPPYEESYAEPAYEAYDSYGYGQQQQAPPPQADTEYYDYGHGETQEAAYEPYAQDDWQGSWPTSGGKAPPARGGKGAYREHPYGRY